VGHGRAMCAARRRSPAVSHCSEGQRGEPRCRCVGHRNREALASSSGIVLRALAAQGVTQTSFADVASVHERLFGAVGWPALHALRAAFLARQRELDGLSRARRIESLGWAPDDKLVAAINGRDWGKARTIRSRLQVDLARNLSDGWSAAFRRKLARQDRGLSELEDRLRADGVEIDWTPRELHVNGVTAPGAPAFRPLEP
jgi:hypothetical protein